MGSCRVGVRVLGLVLSLLPGVVAAQTGGTIRGRVTEGNSGAPIPDVTVTIESGASRLGGMTQANGEYSIANVPAGQQTVVARRIGFEAQRRVVTVTAGQTAVADFTMQAAATTLSEVVVTGTAAPTEKRAIGTSIASVDSAMLRTAQAVTVDAALQGKVAGAQIVQNSGNPGGGGVSVRLRGTSSFISGADPLYIVDGVIVDNSSIELRSLGARGNVQNRLADINPADIERIEIIRGAAAAALYGSRANNGVVQIFTRRGTIGRPRLTLNSRYSQNELRKRIPVNTYPFDFAGNPVTRYDYQDDLYRTGFVSDNTLSAEGGSETTRYFVSGTYMKDEGILESTSSERKGGRVNLTQQLLPKLQLDVGANFINTENAFQVNGEGNGVITSFLFTPTSYSFYPVNGIYPLSPVSSANPLLMIERFENPQSINRFIGNSHLRYVARDNLTFDYTLGYDGYSMDQREFVPRGAFAGGANANGLSASVVRDSRIINQDAVATWTVKPSDWSFATSAGFNHTAQTINTTTATALNLGPIGDLVSIGATPGSAQSRVELVTLGYWLQESVSWRDRLYLTGAVRMDASSTFGPDERWQLFPKISASYVIGDEDWSQNSALGDGFSSLRLRGALGYAGNQPSVLNAYQRFDSYVPGNFDGRPGLVNSITLGNAELKPERQREFEVGADLGFWRDRVALEATYYDKIVEDLLFFAPVAISTGYSRQFSAIGEMSNKGFELLARTINMDRPDFRWEMTATYTRNRNKVEELSIPDFQSASGYPNRIKKGDPVGVFYGAYAARNCSTGAFLLDSLGRLRPSNTLPADINARRALGGGECNDSVSKVLGDPNPDWLGSLLNEFAIGRNLRVRLLLDGTFGGDVMNLSARIQDLGAASNGIDAHRELLPYGDPRKLPPGYLARRLSIFEQYTEDGTFMKVRELSATYSVNWQPITRVFRGGMDVTVAGRNLFVWTDYSGYDPEGNLFGQNGEGTTGTVADRGFDFAAYPIPRTWSIGVRLGY
jgi:TonB-dependent SusC/RagA subfamily outer membrane receptor